MSTNDMNSITARTLYRIKRRLGMLLGDSKQTQPPEIKLSAQSLPTTEDAPDARIFVPSEYGSGVFGKWIVDKNGLPAYQYEMNQYENDDARYPVSLGAFRRDHWHQVGNDRITGLASNDGVVQVFIGDQGFMYLNHFSHGQLVSLLGTIWDVFVILVKAIPRGLRGLFFPSQEPTLIERLRAALSAPGAYRRDDLKHAYAGGFGYLEIGGEVCATAYKYQPELRNQSERIFGMGYFQTSCTFQGIKVDRTVYAPAGDVPAMITDVKLTNITPDAISLSYYEYWDVNVQQLSEQLLRTGEFGAAGDSKRRQLNREFTPCIMWDEQAKALRFHLQPPEGVPATTLASGVNWSPSDIFLADLSGTPDGKHIDKNAFFGEGGAESPDAIGNMNNLTEDIPHTIMPYCMVLRRDIQIPAGETKRLRFAYGTVDCDDRFDCDPSPLFGAEQASMPEEWKELFQHKFHLDHATSEPLHDLTVSWRERLAYFSVADSSYLQREMAWHTYYLLSSTLKNQFFGIRVVPQGSAYLYLHGIDGVPRDFSLYVLTLSYLSPKLAKELLCFVMNMTYGDSGQIAYSYTGNGWLSGAIIHEAPSDLDLFFLLAIIEYIAVTGDNDFLFESVPFYHGHNQPRDQRVINHIRIAYRHLMHKVGIGEHDLIRVRDGDWSDDVVIRNIFPFVPSVSPRKTVEEGESVLNSQMALYILPRLVNFLQHQPSEEAQNLGTHIQQDLDQTNAISRLTQGIRNMWVETHYARAILRTWRGNKYILHAQQIDLEAQVWAFIADYDPTIREKLFDTIYNTLDEPSLIGATLHNGAIWSAISQLLTWGYTRHYPDKAWNSFLKQTLATRAEVYGHRWSNIWSGPDGVNGATMLDPGGTYQSPPATPMMDFPIMNNNLHAMNLLALTRVCGIEPHESGEGLCIKPQIPETYKLDLPLLKLHVSPDHITGEYRAHNTGQSVLFIQLANPSETLQICVANQSSTQSRDSEGYIRLELPSYTAGDTIPFEVFV